MIACAMAIAMTVNAQTSQETDFPPTEEMNIADSILLEVTYDVTVKYGKPKEATRNDVMTLEIGNSVWHSWLKRERKADYARMKSLYTSGRRGLGFFTFPYTYIGEVFGNFPQGQATVIKNLDAAGVECRSPYISSGSVHSQQSLLKLACGLVCKGNRKNLPGSYTVYTYNIRKMLYYFRCILVSALGINLEKTQVIFTYRRLINIIVCIAEEQHICNSVTENRSFTASCTGDYKNCTVYLKNRFTLAFIGA